MARKSHRPDDIIWSVSDADIAQVLTANRHIESSETITLGALLDLKYPRKAMVKLFEDKLIHVNEHKANPHRLVASGDTIWIGMAKEKIDHEPIEMDLVVLYEDDDLLIVDKPAGVTVNSPNQVSLANGIAHYFKEHSIKRKVRFLNRLDRDTTGCIVIAKSGLAQSLYQQQMDSDTFEKWYRATVEGIIADEKGSLIVPMRKSSDGIHYEVHENGKETRTDFTVIHRSVDKSVDKDVNNTLGDVENHHIHVENVDKMVDKLTTDVDVRLWTGKTHQIRVAFSHIGHPLVGDTLYGAQPTEESFKLRAVRVVFNHMRTGKRIVVNAISHLEMTNDNP